MIVETCLPSDAGSIDAEPLSRVLLEPGHGFPAVGFRLIAQQQDVKVVRHETIDRNREAVKSGHPTEKCGHMVYDVRILEQVNSSGNTHRKGRCNLAAIVLAFQPVRSSTDSSSSAFHSCIPLRLRQFSCPMRSLAFRSAPIKGAATKIPLKGGWRLFLYPQASACARRRAHERRAHNIISLGGDVPLTTRDEARRRVARANWAPPGRFLRMTRGGPSVFRLPSSIVDRLSSAVRYRISVWICSCM